MDEAGNASGWYYATLPTGMFGFLLMLLIAITSLRSLRRKSYNTFYYIHVICSVFIFLALSVHASTDFYFLLPGLILLLFDWAWRIFKGYAGGLSRTLAVTVENAGDGWYRINLPAVAKQVKDGRDAEEEGPAMHPLQSYNLSVPEISKFQNHAFTAAKVGSLSEGPAFLLQRAGGKSEKKLQKEWTWKLAALVPSPGSRQEVQGRVEGPYIPSDIGFTYATNVVCIVGGTGLTGACSLAVWWAQQRSHDSRSRFSIIWTVRHGEHARVREWREMISMVDNVDNMNCTLHVSSENGRMDTAAWLRRTLVAEQPDEGRETGATDAHPTAWVYVSGPDSLLRNTEAACVKLRRDLRGMSDLAWYSAKWEV